MNKMLIFGAVGVVVIIVAVAFFFMMSGPALKDCGTITAANDSASQCLDNATRKCEPAKVSIDVNNSYASTKGYEEIRGGTPTSCNLYLRIDKYRISSEYSSSMSQLSAMMEGKEMTCTGIDISSSSSSSFMSPSSQMLEKCTGSLIDFMKNMSGYTVKPPVSSPQVAISITDCNCSHVLVRNTGALEVTKDADLYSSAGAKVGVIKFSSNQLSAGEVDYVLIQNTTPVTNGVYSLIDNDYPEYTFTCYGSSYTPPSSGETCAGTDFACSAAECKVYHPYDSVDNPDNPYGSYSCDKTAECAAYCKVISWSSCSSYSGDCCECK
jgi:hypothetical protein